MRLNVIYASISIFQEWHPATFEMLIFSVTIASEVMNSRNVDSPTSSCYVCGPVEEARFCIELRSTLCSRTQMVFGL